jgi:hypothetical protein
MTQQFINTGTYPMDTSGDVNRVAFQKCNAMFTELGLAASITPQLVNVGVVNDDGRGDTYHAAFDKINANFAAFFGLLNQPQAPIRCDPGYPRVVGAGAPDAFLRCNAYFSYLYVYL